jgi:hypothetical protein
MYKAIVSVRANQDLSLSVIFEDGVDGVLDMNPYLDFGVFRRIKDFEQFKRVKIAFDTIAWERGVDLDPEFVRAKCRTVERT